MTSFGECCSYHSPKTDYDYISDYGFIPDVNDVGRVSKITFGQVDYSMWKRARKEGLWGTLNPAEQGNHQGKGGILAGLGMSADGALPVYFRL